MKDYDLEAKIERLQTYMDRLLPYVSLETEEILKNEKEILSIERLFQLMVDEAIDINSHIAYSIGEVSVSDSYRSTFHNLVSVGIIDYSFAEKISYSASIRNQIVHEYEKMQQKDVIEKIKYFFDLYKEYTRILIQKYVSL